MLPDVLYIQEQKYVKEKEITPPEGYSLYQMGDDFQTLGGARDCASGGCPAVMVLPDERTARPDTKFTEQWQFFVYAINKGMPLSAIIATMGTGKALFNTGNGIPPCMNALTGNPGNGEWPRLDKLRTFSLNTHALKPSGWGLQLLTFDGRQNPPLKPGRRYPNTLEEVNPDDYLYMPQTHRWMFMDCTNVKWKPTTSGQVLSYGPWANGLVRPWIGDGKMHTFFPLVSWYINICPANEWNKVPAGSPFPSPFRQP